MKNVVMSTKGTNTTRKNTGIIFSLLTILIGIFVIAFYCYASEYTYSDRVTLLLLLGFFIIGDGIMMAGLNYINGSTYIDVYEDRLIGKGIQNLNALNFNIKFEQINNISVEGFWIHIHTSSGAYKVMTDKSTAEQVFSYYVQLKG